RPAPDTGKKKRRPTTNFQQQDTSARLLGGMRCTCSLHFG
ncbi:uncharacterized, partial [Tachysurus ichikawai]